MLENTYWNNKGAYSDLYEKLNALIPAEGAVDNARKNRALEKLRKAANCYYDLYNNGLYNRAAQFRQVFGFGGTAFVKGRYSDNALQLQIENKMDGLILAAAHEQRVV